MNNIIELLLYPFVIRAVIAGIALSISTSLLGTFLVLKRFSLIGDGLAHVSFFAVALSLLFGDTSPFMSITVLILASIIIMKLNESGKMYADAAIGLMGAFSIALGTIFIQYVTNVFVNVENYLFGSILLVSPTDLYLSIIVMVTIGLWLLLFYRPLFAMTYEEDFAKVNKVPTVFLNYSLAILTAVSIYVGIQVVGTLLISSLIIFPTVIAMQFTKSFKSTLLYAACISVVNLLGGFVFSIGFDWPTGSTIVVFSGLVFALTYVAKWVYTLTTSST
jgi:ABC-type Mn2+/Zn2+ transport system permease subunit